jgi:hypothetical protein
MTADPVHEPGPTGIPHGASRRGHGFTSTVVDGATLAAAAPRIDRTAERRHTMTIDVTTNGTGAA